MSQKISTQVKKEQIHQYTLHDVIALRGDEPHDKSFYIFSKKTTAASPVFYTPSRSDFYTILLVTKGNIAVKINLIDYVVEQDAMVFLYPNTTVQFSHFSDDLVFYGIAFMPGFLTEAGINKKYLDALSFLSSNNHPTLTIKHSDTAVLCSSMGMLYKRSHADNHYPFRAEIVQHLFAAFLYEMAAVYKNNTTGNRLKLTRNEEITVRFLRLLPDHFKEERSVQYYADQLFVTPKYLSETIKGATGKTAGHFIDEMVVLEAKVLLKNAALSIAQIAEELHFSDQFTFSKFFKRIAGTTPSEYRKQTA